MSILFLYIIPVLLCAQEMPQISVNGGGEIAPASDFLVAELRLPDDEQKDISEKKMVQKAGNKDKAMIITVAGEGGDDFGLEDDDDDFGIEDGDLDGDGDGAGDNASIFTKKGILKILYNTSKKPTPKDLRKPMMKVFADVMKDFRGKEAMIYRLYAKKSGSHIVLYVHINPPFMKENKAYQKGLAKRYLIRWATYSKKVSLIKENKEAHLVLTNKRGHVLGGYSWFDGKLFWIDERR